LSRQGAKNAKTQRRILLFSLRLCALARHDLCPSEFFTRSQLRLRLSLSSVSARGRFGQQTCPHADAWGYAECIDRRVAQRNQDLLGYRPAPRRKCKSPARGGGRVPSGAVWHPAADCQSAFGMCHPAPLIATILPRYMPMPQVKRNSPARCAGSSTTAAPPKGTSRDSPSSGNTTFPRQFGSPERRKSQRHSLAGGDLDSRWFVAAGRDPYSNRILRDLCACTHAGSCRHAQREGVRLLFTRHLELDPDLIQSGRGKAGDHANPARRRTQRFGRMCMGLALTNRARSLCRGNERE